MYDKPTSPFKNRVYALCKEDMKFRYANGRVVMNLMTAADANVPSTHIRWQYQKKFIHSEATEFEALPSNPMFCLCLAAL